MFPIAQSTVPLEGNSVPDFLLFVEEEEKRAGERESCIELVAGGGALRVPGGLWSSAVAVS